MELSGDFGKYLSSIEPDENAIAAAKTAHEKVRERLKDDEQTKDAHKDTFLSGSYARRTAIHNINDVDVICMVDIDHTVTEPEVVLSWLKGVLSKHYTETRLQGRSIGASASKGVWLDIVPGTPLSADDGPLWIPDRDAKEWVQAHPKGQIAASTSKNKATNGYYVQTAKLLKSWRDRLPTKKSKPKSYILETLIHQTIGLPTCHARAVVNVIEGIQNSCGWYRGTTIVPQLLDPGYSSVNVAKRWSSADFDAFLDQVKPAAQTARQALDATDEAESRKLWRKLFGSTLWPVGADMAKPPSSPGSLVSPAAMGGIVGGKGFDFQTRYTVCHLPLWLQHGGFHQIFSEGTGDIDIRYVRTEDRRAGIFKPKTTMSRLASSRTSSRPSA